MECCGGKKQEVTKTNDICVDVDKITPVLEKYKNKRGSLITILQETQEIYGYLPLEILEHIGKETGLKPANIYGVATFYTQFRLKPIGKYLIMLCQGTACHVNGSKAIEKAICEELSINEGETTADNLFTLHNVACLGCCSLSPVMMINGETYAKLTPDQTKEILKEIRESETKGEEV